MKPGEVIHLGDDRTEHLVLAVEHGGVLLLHVEDGCTWTWIPCIPTHTLARGGADYKAIFEEREKQCLEGAKMAVFELGAKQALWRAQEAGKWSTLARLVAALRSAGDAGGDA
jgi:hypothetical protein